MLVRLLPLVSVPCTNKLHIRGLTILAAFRFFSLTLPSSSCVLSPVARRLTSVVCRLSALLRRFTARIVPIWDIEQSLS